MWIEFAIFYGLYAVGSLLLGHFGERTPPARKLAKLAVFSALNALVYRVFGRPWSLLWLALPVAAVAYIHAVWLPKHGVNGLTGEPRERYYALRGWSARS